MATLYLGLAKIRTRLVLRLSRVRFAKSKMTINNTNILLVNDNVYTKIWLINVHSFSRY